MTSKFLWNGKRARIRSTTLQRPKLEGGLALPNFKFYHWAFQLQSMRTWTNVNSKVPWRVIEEAIAAPHRLQDLLYIKQKRRNSAKLGSIVSYSLLVWGKVQTFLGNMPLFHKLSPLWNNPLILTADKPFAFPPWAAKGIQTLENIYGDNGLLSFQELRQMFDIPVNTFFLYLRLRSSLLACGLKCDTQMQTHPLSEWFSSRQWSRGWVTRIYNTLIRSQCKPRPITDIWDRELKNSEPNWQRIWSNINNTCRSLSHQLISLKIIHRCYATPYRLYRMSLLSSPECTLCSNSAVGTVLHMFWECDKVKALWTHVCDTMSKILWFTINPDPCLCLLNDDTVLNFKIIYRRNLFCAFTAAKKNYFGVLA